MIALEVLKKAAPEELAKAATCLQEGRYFISVSAVTPRYLTGVVHGGEQNYEVMIAATRTHCTCLDAKFRRSICKHLALFSLVLLRATQEAQSPCRHVVYGAVTGCQACGSRHLSEEPTIPTDAPPNLTLAHVRPEYYARSATY